MNRRDMIHRVLGACGAGAAVAAMQQEGLLAMPDEAPTPSDWHFDGRPESFLERLNVMTARYMFAERVRLHRFAGEIAETSDPWWMLGAAFKLDLVAKVFRDQRRVATADDRMVYASQAMCFAQRDIDPIKSVDELARQFAERMIQEGATTLGRLPIPFGPQIAIATGVFRLVCAYDAYVDAEVMRVDTIVGRL